jgi:predicted transcriptional regulator
MTAGIDRPVVRWVNESTVRSAVLSRVADEQTTTALLIEGIEASESAVYAALKDLGRRDLIAEREEEWTVTGRGQLVTDLIDQQRATEQLFADDPEYWRSHDVSVLPARFRQRLGELTGGDVIRRTDTDPRRVIREVSNRIADADHTQILAPIYTDEYATAMPDSEQSRLLLSQQVVEEALEETVTNPAAEEPDETEIRIGEAPVGLTVVPDAVMVSFPTLDGSYDPGSEILVETDAAREWGSHLFEYYWERAMPVPGR